MADYLLRKENTCRCELAVPIQKLAERRTSAHRSCPTACRTCAAAAPWRCSRCSCAARSARLDHLEQEVDAGPLLQPPAANARKKRSVPRLARSRQRARSHGSSGPQSARSCSKCVREWFENGSHRGSSSSCARASSPGLAAAPWSWLCRRRRAAQGRNCGTSYGSTRARTRKRKRATARARAFLVQ